MRIFIVNISFFFLLSCSPPPEVVAEQPAPVPVEKEEVVAPPAAEPKPVVAIDSSGPKRAKKPSLRPAFPQFDSLAHDFGEVIQDSVLRHRFHFENTGERPLEIESVQGSCGCIQGSQPFLPIGPGEKSYIDLRFDSRGRQGAEYKYLLVNWKGNEEPLKLEVRAKVLLKEKK